MNNKQYRDIVAQFACVLLQQSKNPLDRKVEIMKEACELADEMDKQLSGMEEDHSDHILKTLYDISDEIPELVKIIKQFYA